MKLSSCRELKQQIMGRAQGLAVQARPARRTTRGRGRGRGADRIAEPPRPVPLAAVGVAPADHSQYKLAVRIYRGQERHCDRLLHGLGAHMDEVDLVTGLRYKPRITLRAGGSCGHFKITAGTLGGFVEDDDHYYIMSNNHVLANGNFCFGGDPIQQPGPDDVTTTARVIGHLQRWFPLSRDDPGSLDVALARFSDAVEYFDPYRYTGIGTIGREPVASRYAVTRVIKRGRTTDVTRGRVSAYELDGVSIDYGRRGHPGVVTFDDQIEIVGDPPTRDFSAGGDSGSFIIDRDTMRPYALLYGGGPDAQGIDRTLAHFMPDVLGAMNVRLVQ